MPPKMVQCAFCGDSVSKRQSLSLKELGAGDGRACRKHPEVQEMIAALQEKRAMDEAMDAANRTMRILSGVSMIRVMHSFQGVPLHFLYQRLRQVGYTEDMIDEVRTEVDRQGGAQMSDGERFTTVISAVEWQKRMTG